MTEFADPLDAGYSLAGRQGRYPMEHTSTTVRFRSGDRVEVVTRFSGAWVGGFAVASTTELGCRVRRLSDGDVLPVVFGFDDVRHQDAVPEVLRLPADLDIATVEEMGGAALDVVDHSRGIVVVDLADVQFVDSYGIRLLVSMCHRARERDVPLRLVGGSPLVRALLDLVGLDLFRPEPNSTMAGRRYRPGELGSANWTPPNRP